MLCSKLVLTIALACTAAPVAAQQQPVVVRAARLLDVEAGRIVAPAVVVVQDGRIVSVGGAAPAGAEVIDLGDLTLVPGLIDLHTHLTGDIEGAWVWRPVTETAADAALRGARNARRTLEAGFTTVRDLGSGDFVDVSLMKASDADIVRLGMTPIAAVRSATTVAAELLGVDDRGAIAPGKLADLIAVPGDPLQDVRHLEDVRFVMKGGRVYVRR